MNSTASLVSGAGPEPAAAAPRTTGTDAPFSAMISRAARSASARGALPKTVVIPSTSTSGALSAATMA